MPKLIPTIGSPAEDHHHHAHAGSKGSILTALQIRTSDTAQMIQPTKLKLDDHLGLMFTGWVTYKLQKVEVLPSFLELYITVELFMWGQHQQ